MSSIILPNVNILLKSVQNDNPKFGWFYKLCTVCIFINSVCV